MRTAGLDGRGPMKTLSPRTEFAKLWTAYSISRIGSEVTTLALPLTAVHAIVHAAFAQGLQTELCRGGRAAVSAGRADPG